MKITRYDDGSVFFEGRIPFTTWQFYGAWPDLWRWNPSKGVFGPVTFECR